MKKGDIAKIIARAWREADYKARLKADPHAVLAESGVEVPAGTAVKVQEDTNNTVHLVLPLRPPGDLSMEELERAAGGRTDIKTPGVY